MSQAVRVLVDEPAIDREFTYLAADDQLSGRVPVQVGTLVWVPLGGRRIRGWVTETDVGSPGGVELRAISRVVGYGPPPAVVSLASWAAWRWAGTRAHFLRVASSDRVVAGLPAPREPATGGGAGLVFDAPDAADLPGWLRPAFERPALERLGEASVVRLGPCADELPLVAEACRAGRALILVPTTAWAARLAGRLRKAGVRVAVAPRDWAAAAAADAVVGTRTAAWAPCGRIDAVVVLDEHDEAYQSEAVPTWNGRDVAVERAGRDGAVCVLVSPVPSTDALHSLHAAGGAVFAAPSAEERKSWPRIEIADRRRDDPAAPEWCGEALTELLRSDQTVVCVLNRTGRARLAYCASCGELARSGRSGRALRLEGEQFVDPEDGTTRPAVCTQCGATRFRRARVGVKGVAEEMRSLSNRPVIQVVGESAKRGASNGAGEHVDQPELIDRSGSGLYIGTEAVLHRVPTADAVAFLDFDQELSAPRYRAAEEAFALLVRAARLVGPGGATVRTGQALEQTRTLGPADEGGLVLVQTRMPDHPVLRAAVNADPSDWAEAELDRRTAMSQPPSSAWALVSGAAAGEYIERLKEWQPTAGPLAATLDIAESDQGTWRVRSPNRQTLLDALAQTDRPPGRLRVAIDPLRA